jgi:DNA-directed RNA polymerase subunit alpha
LIFAIEPLEVGQSITLGNSLRRTLLSDLTSYAITSVIINNVEHEFDVLPFLREDILEVLLHLKDIIFKPCKYALIKNRKKFKAQLAIRGPTIVTAGMFWLPKRGLSIINPKQYICTITNNSCLLIELEIEQGKAYRLVEENRKLKKDPITREKDKHKIEDKDKNKEGAILLSDKEIKKMGNRLFVDSLFMPIKKVNYKVKLIHDTKGNIKESLLLEITTNGSLTPKRALLESLKLLLDLFSPLLIDACSLTLSKDLKNLKKQKL